jgi:hypothetical protein
LINKWGGTLLEVHIRHRRGNDPKREESCSCYCIPANEETAPMPIEYETDSLSFDYWWVKFVTLGGVEYQTDKDNFFCNITASDSGDVTIRIDPDTEKMYVIFNYSGGCSQGLKKIS